METRLSIYRYSKIPSKRGSASLCQMFSDRPNLLERECDNRLRVYYQQFASSASLNLQNGGDKSEGMSINIFRYYTDFQGFFVTLRLDKSLFPRECDNLTSFSCRIMDFTNTEYLKNKSQTLSLLNM